MNRTRRTSPSPSSPALLLWLFLLLFAGCDRQQETPADGETETIPSHSGTIIAAGDSLTAGYGVAEDQAYPALLEKKLRGNGYNWQVINAGISGETSSGVLSRINWIIAQHPDIVILEIGANDGLRGIPVSVIRDNLDKSVQRLQEENIVVVLAGMQMVRNLGPAYAGDFAKIYPAVAKEREVILVPFFLEGVAGKASLNQPDAIHPTPEGYEIVAETVYPYVVKAIKAVR